ncbi:iron ABC transporter permease [Lachnoanaerobaculum sp. Marseille-Q4761]|uniref:FecCD family ABC transporter permease n=1 Tax=Lachnoanaerobaculum sp. Marseille-Q4761 TaxID=2819511 RepID=UPI001AA1032C|nr:iron ABC transporter permease [Lachnoanaerobaculum sp. Marseille-Q4761]MBO1871261.1 iron ABC transporter permease [Lachnoanaerobaculum sp. Marseille-Q4761]
MLKTKNNFKFAVLLTALSVSLIFSAFISVSLGAVQISLKDTFNILISNISGNVNISNLSGSIIAIVWNMRVPRVIMGIIVGAGLAICGSVMQTTVNNPISEPYILGISAGATFGATFFIILGLKSLTGIGAFFGSVISTVVVLFIASIGKKFTTTSLILSGAVVNALFSAFSNFIISIGANSDSMMTIKFWTMGSLASASWSDIALPMFIIFGSFIFFLFQHRILNTMLMGDDVAITLGINLYIYRFIYMIFISMITGILVAKCGIIGFVGLITPHISRILVGTEHKKIITISSILGSLFILWSDILARCLIDKAELPIGIFTSLVGGPFFIYIVIKNQKGGHK